MPRQGCHTPRAPSQHSYLPWGTCPWPYTSLLQGAASCDALASASPDCSSHPKVLDQDTDAIAVHVVRVLTCIMSGSPSAKVRALQSACSGGCSGGEVNHMPRNWPGWWLLEPVSWGGSHRALWGVAQASEWAWSPVGPGSWISWVRAG